MDLTLHELPIKVVHDDTVSLDYLSRDGESRLRYTPALRSIVGLLRSLLLSDSIT